MQAVIIELGLAGCFGDKSNLRVRITAIRMERTMKQLIIAYLLIASFVFITHKDSSAKQDDDPGLT